MAVICRSVVAFGLSTFLALFAEQKLHAGTDAGEAAIALLFVTGAVGTLISGQLAGRWGRIRTIRFAYAATVPGLAGLLWAPGYSLYVFIAAVGLASYLPFSLHVTLGQDYLPGHVGTASGVTLGLAVSVGGLAAPLIGAAAQASSLPTALTALVTMPVLAWAVSRRLPEPRNIVSDLAAAPADGPFPVPAAERCGGGRPGCAAVQSGGSFPGRLTGFRRTGQAPARGRRNPPNGASRALMALQPPRRSTIVTGAGPQRFSG